METVRENQAVSIDVTFNEEIISPFVELSGDSAPVHTNSQHAQKLGFEDRIVHGFLVGVPFSRLLGMELPGPNSVIQQIHIDMINPVYIGDKITYQVSVKDVIQSVSGVKLKLIATNQDGVVVNRGNALCIFRNPIQHADKQR